MAQLMVSVRYFNEGVSEDMLCLIPLKGTTTARDVCSALLKLKFGEENYLTWENVVSLCTDGAPSMLGRQAGFVALFRQEIGKPNLISYHCIIHQQELYAIAGCGLQDTMKTVVESVKLIRARSLKHRWFQNHLVALDNAEFGDVLFYTIVRWLRRGEAHFLRDLLHCFLTSWVFSKKLITQLPIWKMTSFGCDSAFWQTFSDT